MRVYRAVSAAAALAAYLWGYSDLKTLDAGYWLVVAIATALAVFSIPAALRVRCGIPEATGIAAGVAALALSEVVLRIWSAGRGLTPALAVVRAGMVLLLLGAAVAQAVVAFGGAHRAPVPVSATFRRLLEGTAAVTYASILVCVHAGSIPAAPVAQLFPRAWALLLLLLTLAITVAAARATVMPLVAAGCAAVILLAVEVAWRTPSVTAPWFLFTWGSHLGIGLALFAVLVGAITYARPVRGPEGARPPRVPKSLYGRGIVLRPLRPQDARAIWEAVEASRAGVTPWVPVLAGSRSLQEQRAQIIDLQSRWAKGERLIFGCFDRSTGRFLGSAGFHRIDWRTRVFELVFWVRVDAQRQGYASECVRVLARLAFDQLGANRVELRAAPTNIGSQRLAQRLGFVMEGTLRACVLDVDGRPADRHVFALVHKDYAGLSWSMPAQ